MNWVEKERDSAIYYQICFNVFINKIVKMVKEGCLGVDVMVDSTYLLE